MFVHCRVFRSEKSAVVPRRKRQAERACPASACSAHTLSTVCIDLYTCTTITTWLPRSIRSHRLAEGVRLVPFCKRQSTMHDNANPNGQRRSQRKRHQGTISQFTVASQCFSTPSWLSVSHERQPQCQYSARAPVPPAPVPTPVPAPGPGPGPVPELQHTTAVSQSVRQCCSAS